MKDLALKPQKGSRTNDPTMRLKDLSTITGESVSKIAAMLHNSATAPKPRLTIRSAHGGGVPANYYSCAELIAWYNSLPGRHVDAVAHHGYIRVPRESLSKRMTPKVLDFLKVARGVKELAPDVGMHPNTLYKLLQALRYEKKVHICGYRDYGRPMALWIAGEGKDAPVPKKMSRAEVSKRYRLRDEAGKVIAKLSPMRSVIVPKAKVEVRRDPLTAAFFGGGQ